MACNYSKMPVNQTYISKEQCENTLTVMVHVHEIMHRCFLQNCASEKKIVHLCCYLAEKPVLAIRSSAATE